jgi:hypothetical protein
LPRASYFDAGWSSPVARQAHNLKVVGSNPTPATKFAPPIPGLGGVHFFAGAIAINICVGPRYRRFIRMLELPNRCRVENARRRGANFSLAGLQ